MVEMNLTFPRPVDEYQWRILNSLRHFQSIEMMLKIQLSQEENIEDKAMGPLLQMFFKMNNVDAETRDFLNTTRANRNTIAHQALVDQRYISEESKNLSIEKLKEIERQASDAMLKIVKIIANNNSKKSSDTENNTSKV